MPELVAAVVRTGCATGGGDADAEAGASCLGLGAEAGAAVRDAGVALGAGAGFASGFGSLERPTQREKLEPMRPNVLSCSGAPARVADCGGFASVEARLIAERGVLAATLPLLAATLPVLAGGVSGSRGGLT